MANGDDIKRDLAALQQELMTLGAQAGRVGRSGLRAGIKVIEAGEVAEAARAPGPRVVQHHRIDPGGLAASLGSKLGRVVRDELGEAKAGLGVGKSQAQYGDQVVKGKRSVPYGHFVLLGTSERFTGSTSRVNKKTGRVKTRSTGKAVMYRGRVDANRFVERGARAAEGRATQAVIAKIDSEIQRLRK